VERPQAEPVDERPLHATEDGQHRGSEEEPTNDKRSRISPTKRIPWINNWICNRSISGVRTHLQSQSRLNRRSGLHWHARSRGRRSGG